MPAKFAGAFTFPNIRLTRAAGSGGRAFSARTRSYKKVLKANVRGRILSWSNWELLLGFSQVFTSSDSPDDAGLTWHCRGEEAKPSGLTNGPAALLCVCVRPMSTSHSPRLMAAQ
jgi:hypothetical protein